MENSNILDNSEFTPCSIQREWRITIQCPVDGVEQLVSALGKELPLKQGAYDNCLYVRENGYQQFRALEGSHAGDEGTVQRTKSSEIVFSIPYKVEVLDKVFETVFKYGVQEEPTISVETIWSSRSKYLDDKDNPYRYWNRQDADKIHGESV